MEKLPASTATPRQAWSWALYDWANSSFTTIILTFVYSTYFVKSVAPDPVTGAAWWGYALAASGLGLALLAPVCGALADQIGRNKRWTLISMIACLGGTAILWGVKPGADDTTILLALGALVVANIGFELGIVFNNALLPQVAAPGQIGRVSSLAWGLGYFGGLCSLVVVLVGLIGVAGVGPFINLPTDDASHVRAAAVVVIVWYALFSLPFFRYVPDRPRGTLNARQSLAALGASLKESLHDLRIDRTWRNFMIGSAIYRDGLSTLFAMGGIYAASRYGLDTAGVLLFGIGINVTAGLGCIAASYLEDRFGSLRVTRWGLIGLILCGAAVLLAPGKAVFFAAALALGLFVGPVQSSSRTMVSRLSTPRTLTGRYGIYALAGRAVSFMGPLVFALSTDAFDNQLAGMTTILLFWLAGFMMIRTLRDPS